MMYQERSKKQAMVKYFAIVPVLLIALFIFSSNTNAFDKELVKQEITDYFATELLDLDDVATYVNTLTETHSNNREALSELFSELNPIGGFTVDINQVGEKFSTCVYLFDNDKKTPTGLYGAYVIKVDALLQQRGTRGEGKLAQEIAQVTEDYLSQKLSRKRVEGYLASQGMRYSIDTKGNVDFLAFKRPFQGRNTNVTVYLTTTTTIVNGVEVSDREAVQREIIKLTKGTNTKKIDLIADGAVTNTKTMEVLDMCSELGLQVHVSTPSAEEKEKDRIIEDLREFGERITVKDTTWKPASKFTFPSGMGSFRIQLKDHQTVVLKSDKMIYKQGVDYDVDRKNGIIKLADLSAIDSDETLTVYLLDENKEDEVAKIAPKNEEGSTEPFRLQLPKDQGVYYEADRMVLTQTEDDDEKDSVLELSGTDSDDKLIIYQLDGKTEDDVVTLIAYGESTDENLSQGDPIIVVNGRMVEKAQYEQLKPEDIASVSVLKGEAAIAKYGEKGKAGVIEVTLKNEHSWISFLDEEPYKVVEHMPRFPGCEDNIGTPKEIEDCGKQEMLKYIYTNIKYPAEARDKGVEGMVVVQFVVNRDGSVTDSKVVRDIGGGTAPEVIRIVDAMPKWIPGRQNGEVVNVLYTLPVRFKLESDEQKETTAEPLQAKDPNYGLGQQTSPLYLLDGKRIDKAEIADTERVITGINVLKGEEAMRKYGDAAKDGAIEITTKTKQAYDREEYTELLALKGPIVYPQPNDGNFRVYFKTDSSSPVTINIYGASGNAIKVFDGIIPEQGTVEQQIELGAFTDGPAFMSIIQDGNIYTEKLIFQH